MARRAGGRAGGLAGLGTGGPGRGRRRSAGAGPGAGGGGRRRPSGAPRRLAPPPCRPGSVCQVPRRAEPQRRAAALRSDVGSAARPERGRSGRWGWNPPEGAPRSSETSAPTLRRDAWRPRRRRRGRRHSHPTHATPPARRHTHAGPAAAAAARPSKHRLEELSAEALGSKPAPARAPPPPPARKRGGPRPGRVFFGTPSP